MVRIWLEYGNMVIIWLEYGKNMVRVWQERVYNMAWFLNMARNSGHDMTVVFWTTIIRDNMVLW